MVILYTVNTQNKKIATLNKIVADLDLNYEILVEAVAIIKEYLSR